MDIYNTCDDYQETLPNNISEFTSQNTYKKPRPLLKNAKIEPHKGRCIQEHCTEGDSWEDDLWENDSWENDSEEVSILSVVFGIGLALLECRQKRLLEITEFEEALEFLLYASHSCDSAHGAAFADVNIDQILERGRAMKVTNKEIEFLIKGKKTNI